MRRLRLAVTTVAVMLLTAGWLVGQEKDKKPEVDPAGSKVKGYLPSNFKKLGLSEEQKQAVYKIRATYVDKLAALEKQKTALKKEEKSEIEKVLTSAQKARLKEIRSGEK